MNINKYITNLTTTLLAIILLVMGVLGLYISSVIAVENLQLKTMIKDIFSLIFATGFLALLWEVIIRRRFLDEILGIIGVQQSFTKSGISLVTFDFHEIQWKNLFDISNTLDIYFAYGSTWRGQHSENLRRFALKKNSSVRIILPDVDDDLLMENLAARFNYTKEKIKEKITSAIQDFRSIFSNNNLNTNFKIYLCKRDPTYSMYLFDTTAVISMYKLKMERGSVPTFIAKNKGEFFTFVKDEFNHLIDNIEITRELN